MVSGPRVFGLMFGVRLRVEACRLSVEKCWHQGVESYSSGSV